MSLNQNIQSGVMLPFGEGLGLALNVSQVCAFACWSHPALNAPAA